ncbi:MAG: hypothetical protein NVV82_12895 [Sporocytophaga sp.]|nr:hypothetical protein [Sporocytophaga sp.]
MKYIVIVILIIIAVGAIQVFRSNKGKFIINNADLIEAGQLLFPDLRTDFEAFLNLFLKDKKTFLANEELLDDYDNFEDLDKLKAIEAIYIFGDSRQKLCLVDWRVEENEGEIERFLEENLQIKTDWKNVNALREAGDEEKQRDGKFIIDLLKTFDKDLAPLTKRMIFFGSWMGCLCLYCC